MRRTRFAPSPTGSLHVGNALSAVAARSLADWLLLRIDDTDPARNVPGGEDELLRDLEWLGLEWDEGPVRQSERRERQLEAGAPLGERFDGVTLVREDGSPTYHLASVVDDIDFGITHIVRGNDHRPNEELHRRLFEALGATPPEFVHHGLILGEDGKKLSKRAEGATVAQLREAGIPAEAVRAYLEELGIPRHDVHYDLPRIRRLATDAIGALSDEELTARVGAPLELAPALRGARDLNEAREFASQILEPEPVTLPEDARPTIERFKELAGGEPHETIRELKAVGGNLRALRLALTGRERGPELFEVRTHGSRGDSGLAQRRHSRSRRAFGELPSVLAQDQAVVDVFGRRRAERLGDPAMQLLVGAVVVAPDHMRDPEVDVVHDAGEVVGGGAVLADERHAFEAIAELASRFGIAVGPRALPDGSLLPADPKPLQIAEDRLLAARDVPLRIGVVDAQQEPVAERPVGDGAEGVADVNRARRARSETNPLHPPKLTCGRR